MLRWVFKGVVFTVLFSLAPRLALAATFNSDCAQLMKALVDAGRSEKIVDRMIDPGEGMAQAFLGHKAVPWVGYFFPFEKGGIAARWQTPRFSVPQKLLSEIAEENGAPGKQEVLRLLSKMTPDELATLSPAEKMDLYMGYYDFRITRRELEERGPRRAMKPEYWEGFCNGRCAAGMLTDEPVNPVRVKNADGVEIVFEPNDIKALLTASYFYVEKYAQMGVPNFDPKGAEKVVDRANAAAFDMALRAMIGESERPFVVDIEPGNEIWNYLAVGYTRRMGELRAIAPQAQEASSVPARAVSQVDVATRVYYVNDIESIARHNGPTTDLIKPANSPYVFQRDYHYTLYLNAKGQIISGAWQGDKHPDFAWFPEGAGTDEAQGTNPHLPFEKVMGLQRKSTARRE